ncbi:MAG: family 43 glycosylhydrolase [Tannerellaceae bacterium]|nr:family 43 glycosylhydrolase [Tannerellaceae bacterium]
MKKVLLTLLCLVTLLHCSEGKDEPNSSTPENPTPEVPTPGDPDPTPDQTYTNPVLAVSLPDPTIIKAEDGYFYLYATEDTPHVPIYRSRDLVNWNYMGTAFKENTRPDFEPGGGIWAPDIEYIDGKYYLFYSMSVWGGEWTCGIGVATAEKPAGPFTDQGKLFRSNEIGVQNSIDPFYIQEEGVHYLFWGSFRGIYGAEITKEGDSFTVGTPVQVAGTAFEGTYIHKKDGYYYMFASIGSCCDGVNSTYELVVGRATELFDDYVDKEGRSMMDNGYTVVIGRNDKFVGNGHCSEIVQDDAGNDWIFYHGVNVNDPSGRVLLMDQVKWDEAGWPYVETASPSSKAVKPHFVLE